MRALFLAAFAALTFLSVPAASAQPAADVEIISDTKDILIAHDDYYRIRFTVTNTGTTALSGAVFVVFEVPGGGEVVRRVENKNLAVGASKTYRFKELFRSSAPLGSYGVRISYEEPDRSSTWDMEMASFTVTP